MARPGPWIGLVLRGRSVISPSGMPKGKQSKRSKRQRQEKVLPFFRAGPVVQHVNMAYRHVIPLIEGSAGAGAVYVYRLNSIFDPDLTGVGTTALGYTGYSAFYTRYKVLRVRVRLVGLPRTDGPITMGFMVGPNSTTTSTPTYWPVEPNSFGKLVQGQGGGHHAVFTVDKMISIPQVLGINKAEFTDTDYSAVFGSNPAKICYMIIYSQGQAGVAATTTFEVRLTFDVELSQPYQAITN